MRLLSVRLIVSLILGVTLVSLLFSHYEVRTERQGLRKDLQRRAEVLGESLAGNIEGRVGEAILRSGGARRRERHPRVALHGHFMGYGVGAPEEDWL